MTSWVELSRDRLAANYRALARAAGVGVQVLGVVKANGYGHGASLCAPVLATAGAPWLGVTDVAEGVAVRAALHEGAAKTRILVMSGLLPEDADLMVAHGLTPVVWTIQQMEWLADAVSKRSGGAGFAVHLEIDTGMSRQGVAPGPELERLLAWLVAQERIRLDGVMTHFASAEVAFSQQTQRQCERFELACRSLAAHGLRPAWLHAGNTSAIDNPAAADGNEPDSLAWLSRLASTLGAQAMVRSGLGLYGYSLPIEQADEAVAARVLPCLHPVMTWKTRVIGVRNLAVGEAVGYNGTLVAQQPMRLALLPVGYADGLRRELSSTNTRAGGWVVIDGRRARIAGRISMNLTTVDVTGLANVSVGDEVVLLGDGITAEDHAEIAETISYEILCGVRAQQYRLV